MQKDVFLSGEGDAYFRRNRGIATDLHAKIAPALQALNIKPARILEIGCSDGTGLETLRLTFNAECSGITPGKEVVAAGRKMHPMLDIIEGTADSLPFPDAAFDAVIFGFCLYLCDPALYPRIVAESNRVLADGGALVIADFLAEVPRSNPYAHQPGVQSYHRDFSRLWLDRGTYRALSRTHGDEGEAVDVLRKGHGTPVAVI